MFLYSLSQESSYFKALESSTHLLEILKNVTQMPHESFIKERVIKWHVNYFSTCIINDIFMCMIILRINSRADAGTYVTSEAHQQSLVIAAVIG